MKRIGNWKLFLARMTSKYPNVTFVRTLTCSLLHQEPDPRVPGSGKGSQGRHGTGWTPESGDDTHLDCAAADDAGSLALPAVVSHDGPP